MLEGLFRRISQVSGINSPELAAAMEQRRSHRLYTDLDIEYRLRFHNLAGQIADQATLKNISQGGAYLECRHQPPLTLGRLAISPAGLYLPTRGGEELSTYQLRLWCSGSTARPRIPSASGWPWSSFPVL